MKVAIVGSRDITVCDIEKYAEGASEIVSGGARGVDSYAAEYARKSGIPLREFFPDYKRHGRAAPIRRNEEIVKYADRIVVIWNGVSDGSRHVISYAKKLGKECEVIIV